MKTKLHMLLSLLLSVLFFSQSGLAHATVKNFDYEEEKIKHSIVNIESHSDSVYSDNDYSDNVDIPVKTREEVYAEYRAMDQEAANILKEYTSEEFYDLTISFEKQDRIAAMYKMLEVYDKATTEQKGVLSSYIASYSPYAGDDNLVVEFKDLTPVTIARASSYSRTAAAQWAIDNYDKYNSNYPDLRSMGGDCANFVSQSMHVGGGMAMVGDWYCYRKNTTYLKPVNVSQLNYSWTLSDPSPWISAKQFKNFWSGRSTTYTYSKSDYTSSSSPAYSAPIYTGHAMSFCYNTLWWSEAVHTVIIVGYDSTNKDYIYAAHSDAKKDGKVKTGISGYDSVTFYAFE